MVAQVKHSTADPPKTKSHKLLPTVAGSTASSNASKVEELTEIYGDDRAKKKLQAMKQSKNGMLESTDVRSSSIDNFNMIQKSGVSQTLNLKEFSKLF